MSLILKLRPETFVVIVSFLGCKLRKQKLYQPQTKKSAACISHRSRVMKQDWLQHWLLKIHINWFLVVLIDVLILALNSPRDQFAFLTFVNIVVKTKLYSALSTQSSSLHSSTNWVRTFIQAVCVCFCSQLCLCRPPGRWWVVGGLPCLFLLFLWVKLSN